MNVDESVLPNSTSMNYIDYEAPHSFSEFSLEEGNTEEDPGPIGPKARHHYTAKQKIWKGQYCYVPLCHGSSGEKAHTESVWGCKGHLSFLSGCHY